MENREKELAVQIAGDERVPGLRHSKGVGLRQNQATLVQGTERKPVWPKPDGRGTQWHRSCQGNSQGVL